MNKNLPQKILPTEAAKIMGVTPQFIRIGLQQNKFSFGTAVKINKRWSYYINEKKFKEYLGM